MLAKLNCHAPAPKRVSTAISSNDQNTAISKPRHDVVLGEIESETIDTIKQTFDARIDTGAATSSPNAVDIEEFERNGKTRCVSTSLMRKP